MSSSKATKYKQEAKRQVEEHSREGSMRTWLQVKPYTLSLVLISRRSYVTASWPPSYPCSTFSTLSPPTSQSTSGESAGI